MLQPDIDRIRDKQFLFRDLRIRNQLHESQEGSDNYINSLTKEMRCRHMTGISEIINLCNNKFNCKFKGEVYKSFTKNPKKECLRERITRFEKMLEH